MGLLLESCYREENVHSIAEMTILGEFSIIDSYGVAVTNLEVADEETPFSLLHLYLGTLIV